jgi:hypothetical protein
VLVHVELLHVLQVGLVTVDKGHDQVIGIWAHSS